MEGDAGLKERIDMMNQKIDELQRMVRSYMESTNQQHFESILECTRNMMQGKMLDHFSMDIDDNLNRFIDPDCENRGRCIEFFKRKFEENIGFMEDDEFFKNLTERREEMVSSIREKTPYPKCEMCVSEISGILDKQLRLMRSLRLYNGNGSEMEVEQVNEDILVNEYLEPLANKQRMQMLKSLSKGTMTFSALSKMTGLKGGNLIFHIQKLLKSGMIVQRHERGDYMITEKGYSTLRGIVDLFSKS
ncbi:MAG: winged helix-turn-helix transcriptional regulator [Candidatus Methanofastidiosa archaeon]|nr:winged helix-turn-helix transcriptional regulator [Candidatus Methanofastidiosa archaeon]